VKGSWEGSGTWQTSGFDWASLIGVAALAGVAAAVAMFVLEFIWYIVAILALLLAGFVIGLVWVLRTRPAREAKAAQLYAARFQAFREQPEPQVTATTVPQLEQHVVNFNFYGVPEDRQAAIIARAIPGTAGDAITEGKNRS